MLKPIIASTPLLLSFLLFSVQISAQIVINEVYPGGGNSGATYNADFVELYNSGGSAVNLTAYKIWYATATGTFNSSVSLTGTIPAAGYYLVQTTNPGTNGVALPTPDQASASPALASTRGNILLTDSTFALGSGFACPAGGTGGVIDRVGYGTGACPENTASSAPGNNSNSIQRTPAGSDTDNNSVDFVPAAATPQASGLPSAADVSVSGRVLNPKGRGLRFVNVMIAGNGLPEPLYATTNMFGRYRFEDIPAGESYVLQVFSKRYEFKQSSMVIGVNDNVTNADFIGRER